MKWKGGRKSSNVDDRRATSSGRRSTPSMGTVMMIWPIIKPLLKTKFGWVIIGLGVAAYFAGLGRLGRNNNSSFRGLRSRILARGTEGGTKF